MTEIALLSFSGSVLADQILCDVIGRIEDRFPGRVRGYYLAGSYATRAAISSSDIDLIILFKDEIAAGERERFELARAECKQRASIALDLALESEAKYFRIGAVWFQTASVLLYGEDVRPLIPRKPVENHIRDLMHSMYPLLARVRGNASWLVFPLEYPDATAPLYGYERHFAAGTRAPLAATKDLVTNVLAVANVLTLLRTRQYAGTGKKRDIPEQYRAQVGDEWTTLVEDVFELCRARWNYTVPEAPAERALLRRLCERALGFENHFLCRYKAFALAELSQPDASNQLRVLRGLGRLVYRDPAVLAALESFSGHADAALHNAASEALGQYR